MKLSLYIHIPFCIRKCPYCDFYSIPITSPLTVREYIEALKKELVFYSNDKDYILSTIYIGGGTPSLLNPEHICRLIDYLNRCFSFDSSIEFTIEVNPGTVDKRRLQSYKGIGVNRLSIGVQSLNDRVLRYLGRVHNSRDAVLSIETARRVGFDIISVDLMGGLKGFSKEQRDSLLKMIEMHPFGLSYYLLSIEEGTEFMRALKSGEIVLMDKDVVADEYIGVSELLIDAGYLHYEISNFCLPNFYSRHNLNYWKRGYYLGIGASAHSFIQIDGTERRWWNVRDVKGYTTSLLTLKRKPVDGYEILSKEKAMIEMIYLCLRTSEGLYLNSLKKRYGKGFVTNLMKRAAELHEVGFPLVVKEDFIFLDGARGFLLLDEIVSRLIEKTI